MLRLICATHSVFTVRLAPFYAAIEDVGLAHAIREGRKNDFVSKEEIDAILAG